MRQKGIAFFLVICMLLAPIAGNVSYAEEVDARAAGTGNEAVQNEKNGEAAAGLFVADWIDWNEDGIPTLNEEAEYGKETGTDILWDAVWSITNNGEAVSANDLHVYRQVEDENGAVSWKEYDARIVPHEKNEELLQFSFTQLGRYHISLSANSVEHEDSNYEEEHETEGDDCIKVYVGYPDIAFYQNEEIGEDSILRDETINYSAGDTWYVLTRPTGGYWEYRDVSFEPLWRTPEVLFEIVKLPDGVIGEGEEWEQHYQRYQVTAKADVDYRNEDDPDWSDIGIRVRAEAYNAIPFDPDDPENLENPYECEREQVFQVGDMDSVKKGLLITDWMYDGEDDDGDPTGEVIVDNDLNGFEKVKGSAPYGSFCFKYNDGKSLEEWENEDGRGVLLTSEPVKAEEITVYVKNDEGRLVPASEDIVTWEPNMEIIDVNLPEGKQTPAVIDFSFKQLGEYLVSYTPKGGEESCAIVQVGYPDIAFYAGETCSIEGMFNHEKSYTRKDRTFYLVMNQWEEEEEGEVKLYPQPVGGPVLTEGKDEVELQKISDTVYKFTVKEGVKKEFNVAVKWKLSDQNGEREWPDREFIHLVYKAVPEVTALTVTPKTAEIEEGKTVQLNAQANSVEGEAEITYKSGNDNIAKVDTNGVVTGVKAGKTEITVTAKAGESTKTETVEITVKEAEKKNPPVVQNPPVAQKNVTASNGSKVTTAADGTASVNTVSAKKNAKSVKVADKVVVNGVEYTVTTVGANAFKSVAKTVTSITLPATITKIDKNAFKGLKKLKKITMKVTAPVTVAKNAFKGVDTKKVTITVSKKMSKKDLAKFQSDLKKAGFKGTVKAK